MSHPFSDPRTEWRINDIEREVRGKADQHEIHTLRSNVDSLERANREISAVVDGLRFELETLKDQVTRMLQQENA